MVSSATETNSSISDIPNITTANHQGILNRNKRQVHYNYDEPNLKTTDGFLKNLVVAINKYRMSTLKSNRYSPEYALTSSDGQFRPGGFNINGITTYSNEAVFVPKEVIPMVEELLHSSKTTFRAGNRDEDKLLSGAYSESTTETYSLKFGEKITVKAGFKVKALASFEVTGELNSEQTWTTAKTYTLTAPSQFIAIKANHKKDVIFSLFRGRSLTKGFLKSKIDSNLKINTFFTRLPNSINYYFQRFLSLSDLIEEVKNSGENDLINPDSIISKEGNDFYLNIPCELHSESSRLEVNIGDETPL